MTQNALEQTPRHVSVLLRECIDNLNIRPDGIYLDGTLGMGGHSYEIASRLSTGRLVGIDRDATAIERAGRRLAPFAERVTLVHGNFADAAAILDSLGIGSVDGMLFDLGVSSSTASCGITARSATQDASPRRSSNEGKNARSKRRWSWWT